MNDLRAKIFTNFRDAEQRWRHYETLRHHYVYQTFDWNLHWHETIGCHRSIAPCLIDVTDEAGRPLAFLPMAIQKRFLGKALIWLGGDITDYQGPLLTSDGANGLDDRALDTLWKILRRHCPGIDYADFHRQPAMIGDLPNPFFEAGRITRAEHALSTQLSGDWSAYYTSKRSKKTRHNDRRKRRRLESAGTLSFVVASSPEEIDGQIAAMLAQKDRYVARLGQLNSLRQRDHDVFLSKMSSDPAVKDDTLLCALKLDDQFLAVQWGVRYRRRFYSIIASYDDGPLSRYSTGDILLRELIAWCFENDVDVLDFTCGDEAYKLAWCDQTLDLKDHLLPFSLLGHAIVSVRLHMAQLKHWARSSEALRGAVAAIRSRTRNAVSHHRPPPAAAAGQQTGSGKS